MSSNGLAVIAATILVATVVESHAFDRGDRGDIGWGAPYNSHLDSYSGRPLGPPLTALPPGYQYYNNRLIYVPPVGRGTAYVPYAPPRPAKRNR